MTPERLANLCELLVELADWLEAEDPGCLDAAMVDAVEKIAGQEAVILIAGGAR